MSEKNKLSTKKLTALAMLTAITVILAIFGTFRIGDTIKIPSKFIGVFITAVLYGPLWGGVVGALGDILNSILFPVGVPIPQITLVEFFYGIIFGLFFYKKNIYYANTVICSLILTLTDLFIVSYILTSVGYFPSFITALSLRVWASLIKFALYIIVCILLKKHLNSLERLIK